MATYLNRATVMGNVGKDPEIRAFQNGDRVANFPVATTETWKDKASGERKERTQWHNIAVFNQPLVKLVENHLRRGSRVYIEGQLEYQKYVDKNGQERTSTQIVLRPYRGEIALPDGFKHPARDGSADATPSDTRFRGDDDDIF